MELQSLAPVLLVDAIEPCLPFWTDRLGFARVAEVKHGDGLGFALLARGAVTLMYQSHASVAEDMRELERRDHETSVLLYVNVDDLDAIEAALGEPTVFPRRTTFYGAKETAYREPGGNVVVFAQHDR